MSSDGVVVDEAVRAAWDAYRVLEQRTPAEERQRVQERVQAVMDFVGREEVSRGTVFLVGVLTGYLIAEPPGGGDRLDPLKDLIPAVIRKLPSFKMADPIPPLPGPGSARHNDDDLEQDVDDREEAEADGDTDAEPEVEQTASPGALAPPSPAPHHNRSLKTARIHPATSTAARAALAFVGLAHLALVAFVTGSVAYLSDDFTGPTSWLLPPVIVLFHAVIGLLYGYRKMLLTLRAVVLPPAVIVMTVVCAVSFTNMHGIHLNPLALGAAWASIFSPGLLALTYAVRAWLGQTRYLDTK